MFLLHLFYDKHNEDENMMDAVSIKCKNCNKDTGLHRKIQQLNES